MRSGMLGTSCGTNSNSSLCGHEFELFEWIVDLGRTTIRANSFASDCIVSVSDRHRERVHSSVTVHATDQLDHRFLLLGQWHFVHFVQLACISKCDILDQQLHLVQVVFSSASNLVRLLKFKE